MYLGIEKMPSHKTHKKISKDWLGDSYSWIHKIMDSTSGLPFRKELSEVLSSFVIHPQSHRKDIVHNPVLWYSLHAAGFITKKELDAALLHQFADTADTIFLNLIDAVYNPDRKSQARAMRNIRRVLGPKKGKRRRTKRKAKNTPTRRYIRF